MSYLDIKLFLWGTMLLCFGAGYLIAWLRYKK